MFFQINAINIVDFGGQKALMLKVETKKNYICLFLRGSLFEQCCKFVTSETIKFLFKIARNVLKRFC